MTRRCSTCKYYKGFEKIHPMCDVELKVIEKNGGFRFIGWIMVPYQENNCSFYESTSQTKEETNE
jgi:hypothetical protein